MINVYVEDYQDICNCGIVTFNRLSLYGGQEIVMCSKCIQETRSAVENFLDEGDYEIEVSKSTMKQPRGKGRRK